MEKEPNIAGASENILGTADEDILNKEKKSGDEPLFSGMSIGISISDSPDLLRLGYSPMHLQDAAVEFARYLLVNGATLIYGGDLRDGGFTRLFSELARLYTKKEMHDQFRFKNYFAWPAHLAITRTMELDFRQNKVQIEKVPPPDNLKPDPLTSLQPDTNENKSVWAKCISYMRETMTGACDARIFLGGQVQNFRGLYPGLAEEACLALSKNIPSYFIGAYGGATREIINLLRGKSSKILTTGFQLENNEYKEFYDHWNNTESTKIDYQNLAACFSEYGEDRLIKINGLNEEENSRLFETNYLPGMVFYVLKGLTNVARYKKPRNPSGSL